MSGTRGKLIVDGEKYIIQIDGDSANPTDFNETEMNIIAIGPQSHEVEAVFKNSSGVHVFTISFKDKIEISKNMLDKNIVINIDSCGNIPLDSSTVNQFVQMVSSSMGLPATRDWSKV